MVLCLTDLFLPIPLPPFGADGMGGSKVILSLVQLAQG